MPVFFSNAEMSWSAVCRCCPLYKVMVFGPVAGLPQADNDAPAVRTTAAAAMAPAIASCGGSRAGAQLVHVRGGDRDGPGRGPLLPLLAKNRA